MCMTHTTNTVHLHCQLHYTVHLHCHLHYMEHHVYVMNIRFDSSYLIYIDAA